MSTPTRQDAGRGVYRRILRMIRRALSQPPHIVLIRLKREVNLLFMCRFGVWTRFQHAAEMRWLDDRLTVTRQLIDERSLAAVKECLAQNPEISRLLNDQYRELLNGRVEVFGEVIDFAKLDEKPWNADWRFGHIWQPAYFKSYDFHESDKEEPYDVKFPWEFSRLGFLVPATLWAALNHEHEWNDVLAGILDDWLQNNPVAYSVNWNPMECSIRAINLILITQLSIQAKDSSESESNRNAGQKRVLSKLLALCELHGKFIFRNIEYTDVRGNHYAANISALTLLGLLLKDDVPEAEKWLDYGHKHLEKEILSQFCGDGVQFEKSIPYHRLVTQLMILSVIALQKSGSQVSKSASDRLHNACRYISAYMRPDGKAPNWGDNDDANVFCFDMFDSSDHRNLLQLTDAWLGNGARSIAQGEQQSITVPLFVPGDRNSTLNATLSPVSGTEYFSDGGMVIVRKGGYFFMTDVGEVGLMGRGGHGHLDNLSFELMIGSEPIVIDIGSYIYTGDASARNYFRSTRAHNVAQVDEAEMATLNAGEIWRLGNEARPYAVAVDEEEDAVWISAKHDGYQKLDDPVTYSRSFGVFPDESRLTITDAFECDSSHLVELIFHFAPDISATLGEKSVAMRTSKGLEYTLNWSRGTPSIDSDWVSARYGEKVPASILLIREQITGSSQIQTEIRAVG